MSRSDVRSGTQQWRCDGHRMTGLEACLSGITRESVVMV